MKPVLNPDYERFNWFTCGKVCTVNNRNVIIVGTHSLFFDCNTGKTYRIKTYKNKKECILLISDFPDEKNKYCGVAVRNNSEGTLKNNKCELISSEVELIFNKNSVKENRKCPYIEFCKSHSKILQLKIKDFPQDEDLKKFKPGPDSLLLKKLLTGYFCL
jgi:hypothetical protein